MGAHIMSVQYGKQLTGMSNVVVLASAHCTMKRCQIVNVSLLAFRYVVPSHIRNVIDVHDSMNSFLLWQKKTIMNINAAAAAVPI